MKEDTISRQAAIRWVKTECNPYGKPTLEFESGKKVIEHLEQMPSAQPERQWIPCSNPPKHHRDVIVRGTEAIGNVTVHKVMQWDVDTLRPTDYAPSIIWREWSEI